MKELLLSIFLFCGGLNATLQISAANENEEAACYIDTFNVANQRVRRNCYMAIKTNLISDALLIPDIGFEAYVGRGWSIAADGMYGWWKNDKRHRYWHAYGGDLALRKWFGAVAKRKPLSGHHLGINGGVFTYDFEFGGRGYMGGKPGGTLLDKMNYAVGVEYGYSVGLAKRLNIDLSLTVGYWGGTYQEYLPQGSCYVWQATKQRHWVGPIKAGVTLVWLIGHGNHNGKKGGN